MRNSKRKAVTKSVTAAVAALALALLGVSSAAFAEDAAPPPPPTITVVHTPEAPAPVVVVPVVPKPVVVVPVVPTPVIVTPVAPAPVVTTPVVPAPVVVTPPVKEVVSAPVPTDTSKPTPTEPVKVPLAAHVSSDTSPAPPEKTNKPKYNLVLWSVPGGSSKPWQPHQTVASNVITDKASLDLLDHSEALVCGSYYQVDLYLNSKTTDALIAGGVLYGPNNPKEDLAYGALGEGHNPWKFMSTPACPPPVLTHVTPQSSHSTYTCNTTTYTVDGGNVLTLTGQKGVVWTITKGSDTETLAAGAGFNGLPPYGVGTYTITGADASSSDLIDVTPVTTTATFVSKDSVECVAPPVVVAPVATIEHACTTDGPSLTYKVVAGTNKITFGVFIGGFLFEGYTIHAGETYFGVIKLGEDSYGGATTAEIKFGDVSLTGVVPVSTNCIADVAVHPLNVWFNDSCGVSDDSINVPGTLVKDSTFTTKDSETGAVTTFSEYSSNQGGYNVSDMTLNGVRTGQVTFVKLGSAPIATPGPDDTYTIVTIDGIQYPQWTYTFDSTPCPLTIIATPPAPKVIPATCTADGSLPPLKDGDGYTAAYNRTFDGPGPYKEVYTATTGNSFKDSLTVSYDLTVDAKLTTGCPTTTPTPTPTPTQTTTTPTPTHSTTPPTILSSNGGANTGLNGTEPGTNTSFWSMGNTSLFGGGALLLIMAAIFGFALVRRARNLNNDEDGVEAQ